MQTQTAFVLPEPTDEIMNVVRQMSDSKALTPADSKYVTFYTRTEKSPEKSKAEGRPIFESVEYVRILTPGDKDTIVDRHVRELDKYVWPEKYTAFRQGKNQHVGTPLDVIGVTPERVLELAHGPAGIKTIEQLADVPDSNLGNLGMDGRKLREKARGYLEVVKGNAPVAELRAANDELKAQNAAMLERLAALEKLATQQGGPKPEVELKQQKERGKQP